MRIAKVAAVAILFLLVPHQAPFAGPSSGDGPVTVGESPAQLGTAADASALRPERARRASQLADEGFVWSVEPSAGTQVAWGPNAEHLETDGYSWSIQNP